MSNEQKTESFTFTYSAKEQEEVKRIREKYVPREDSKMEQLRRLDASVTQKGSTAALVLGIVSALIFGTGMCCCLLWNRFVVGILVGILGMVGVALAYPVYAYITRKEKERIAPEILQLTEELMK